MFVNRKALAFFMRNVDVMVLSSFVIIQLAQGSSLVLKI